MEPRKKKAAGPGTQAASNTASETSNPTDLGASAQRQRLLTALGAGPITTIAARRHLTVLHPAARVMELRKAGHDIATVWTNEPDEQGVIHRVAKYLLQAGGAR